MRGQDVSHAPVTRLGRVGVLLVFMAGFFTMHGFLAVSASADSHTAHVQAAPAPHDTLLHDASSVTAPAGGPSTPEPAEHHDLVSGCVVALVGITVLATAVLVGRAHLLRLGRSVRRAVEQVRRWAGDAAPGSSLPRVALCVIRV